MKDRVVWITGASSGIGKACAMACSQQGAKVILSARNEQKLKEVSNELSGESSILPLDVSDAPSISSKTKEAISTFGQVDVLINNAGISQRGLVRETTLEVDRRIFEVNFFGNIAITKELLPHMTSRGSGNIAVISSIAGKLATAGRSAYAASKHALHGYYDALRAEVSDDGIGIHMICPGYVKTDISINALSGDGKAHGVMDPNQNAGISAEACANSIVEAIKSGKKEVHLGKMEKIAVQIRKVSPSWYHNFILKKAREGSY